MNNFIEELLLEDYNEKESLELFSESLLLRYLNDKTVSVYRDSKARGSFANIYAIYVLVEDYVKKGYHENSDYHSYLGARYSDLMKRMKALPFGEKLQNHALNNRVNTEFETKYGNSAPIPIIRNIKESLYTFNEELLKVNTTFGEINISLLVIDIIDKYVELKQSNFNSFIQELESHYTVDSVSEKRTVVNFFKELLSPNTDARIFELVSFVILKYHYLGKQVYFGDSKDSIRKYNLNLFKTGRTNANDGGIDFIMNPTGRVFQVTEDLNFKKFFLDIDKLNHFPITFVIKSEDSPEEIFKKIENEAYQSKTLDNDVVKKYLTYFEEIISLPTLIEYLEQEVSKDNTDLLVTELSLQAKIEFNVKNALVLEDDELEEDVDELKEVAKKFQ